MKKVYDRNIQILIEGVYKDWQDTSIWSHECLMNEEEIPAASIVERYTTFKDLFIAITENKIRNASVDATMFRKRPQVHLSMANLDNRYTMSEKDFKPVQMRIVFTERKNLSIKYLMENLTAEEFIIYCKEREFLPTFQK